MHWTIIAPFIHGSNVSNAGWLTPFVPGQRHQFQLIPYRDSLINSSWHNRSSRVASYKEWLEYWNQSQQAWKSSQGGIITVFPQLAAITGIRKHIFRRHIPVVAWCFNTGRCYPGFRGWLARTALKEIDQFVVHSRREVDNYSQWLRLPKERFEFVPLQRAEISLTHSEEMTHPFLLAMGSANRDYSTLFEAVERLGLRTVVVAAQHALRNLKIPAQVKVLSSLTRDECYRLAQEARINVVPLLNNQTAAGQVTIIESMHMGCPLIATQCIGSEDYIKNGVTGVLVKPGSVEDLAQAIDQLWKNPQLRQQFSQESRRYAAKYLSDEAAGEALGRILDKVADKIGQY